MSSFEIEPKSFICPRCSRAYGKRSGFFMRNYAPLYKGLGYISTCKNCVDSMFDEYFKACKDEKHAVRQMCRKLDLYWNESLFTRVMSKSVSRTVMSRYVSATNKTGFAGKGYDSTLSEEGTLWLFAEKSILEERKEREKEAQEEKEKMEDIPPEVVAFWGVGLPRELYEELEQRKLYYLSKFPEGSELEIGSEILLRQICNLEVMISKDSAAGKAIDKNVNSLNALLGSLNLKPAQRKEVGENAIDDTPMGVWIKRWETEEPVGDTDPELEDVDGIRRHTMTWFFGPLAKLFGVKNKYSRLFEEALEEFRVALPEFEGDDEDLVYEALRPEKEDDEDE